MDNMERKSQYQQRVQNHKEGQSREKPNTYKDWMERTKEIDNQRHLANKDIMNDHKTSTYYYLNNRQEGGRTVPGA